MVYKNLYLRLFLSFFLISIYLFLCWIDFKLVFHLVLIIYLLIFIEIYMFFKNFKFLPIIYVLLSLSFFISIDFNDSFFLYFNFFIFIIVIFDSFSYFFGKLFGNIKLIKISPNKTLEGFIGGMLTSLSLSLSFAYLFKMKIDIYLFFFIIFIILFAFLGDIIESFFKRKNNLKNSSDFLPGHGGIFDRFDSFMFSIIFYSISFNFIL